MSKVLRWRLRPFEGEVMEKNLSKKEKIKVAEPPSAD